MDIILGSPGNKMLYKTQSINYSCSWLWVVISTCTKGDLEMSRNEAVHQTSPQFLFLFFSKHLQLRYSTKEMESLQCVSSKFQELINCHARRPVNVSLKLWKQPGTVVSKCGSTPLCWWLASIWQPGPTSLLCKLVDVGPCLEGSSSRGGDQNDGSPKPTSSWTCLTSCRRSGLSNSSCNRRENG